MPSDKSHHPGRLGVPLFYTFQAVFFLSDFMGILYLHPPVPENDFGASH